MKAADLKVGTTYVGKNGSRRHIQEFRRYAVIYDVPEGGKRWCSRATFARWAEREANHDEAAP